MGKGGGAGREEMNAWVGSFFVIFGLTIMATVYKGKD